MSRSEITRKNKRLYRLFSFISFLLMTGPLATYVVIAFSSGSVGQKVTLGLLTTSAIILVVINTILKLRMRSMMWIALLGIYLVLGNIIPLLILIAITTVLDELVVTPLQKMYKNRYVINKEIDRRM